MNIKFSLTLLFFSFQIMAAPQQAQEIKTLKDFQTVMTDKKPALIMVYAPWCGACKSMKEPFDQIAEQYKNEFSVAKINAENKSLSDVIDTLSVEKIPTFIIKHVGVISKEQLKQTLNSLLKKEIEETPKKAVAKKPTPKAPQKKAAAKPALKPVKKPVSQTKNR